MDVVRGEAAHAHLDADERTEVIREKWTALQPGEGKRVHG